MTYKVQKDDSNIIIVVYTGEVNLLQRKLAVDEVCDLIVEPESVRLLIDLRKAVNTMSTDEQESFGKYLASRKELKKAKVATVRDPELHSNLVIEAFAFTEGYQVVDFNKKDEAIKWLNGLL